MVNPMVTMVMSTGSSIQNGSQSVQSAGAKTHNRDLLMISISKFYVNKGNVQKILPIVGGASRISLRLIDWFVTNYAKRYNVTLVDVHDAHPIHFNVYSSYRAQLKAYSKQQFDPFRRRDRIDFYYDRDKYVETTIGQLNFFRWMLQNRLIEYIDENFDAIESEMLKAQRASDVDADADADADAANNTGTIRTISRTSITTKPRESATCKAKLNANHVNCAKTSVGSKAAYTPPRTVLFD
jgi:hypothetical protein